MTIFFAVAFRHREFSRVWGKSTCAPSNLNNWSWWCHVGNPFRAVAHLAQLEFATLHVKRAPLFIFPSRSGFRLRNNATPYATDQSTFNFVSDSDWLQIEEIGRLICVFCKLFLNHKFWNSFFVFRLNFIKINYSKAQPWIWIDSSHIRTTLIPFSICCLKCN